MESQMALEFVRVTEAAALQSAQWTGRGDKNSADEAATVAIRTHLMRYPWTAQSSLAKAKWMRLPCCISGKE